MTASMLPELPEVITNHILQRYLAPDDLRAVHQVSSTWRNMVTSRPIVNQRRLASVEAVRINKENLVPHPSGNRSRPSSRSSSADSLQTLSQRSYRLRSCKPLPFKEIHENSICDDNNNTSSSNSPIVVTPAQPTVIVTRSKSRLSLSQNNNKDPKSPDPTSPTKLATKTKALLNGLGNVKRKSKVTLRRIANL